MNLECHDLTSLGEVAQKIIEFAKPEKIWLFRGEMGAGKTTLIKAIAQELSVVDTVASPTFSIVNEYHTLSDEIIFHFDFYRIKNLEEARDIGFEEYLESGHYCFIEWFEKVDPLLPDKGLLVSIDGFENQSRNIQVKTYDRT